MIRSLATEYGLAPTSPQFAEALDKDDALSRFRKEFHYPLVGSLPFADPQVCPDLRAESIYLCGNSLGLQPRRLAGVMEATLSQWADFGVDAHLCGREGPALEQIDIEAAAAVAPLVGATADEVSVMNSLTVNLHLLLLSFYRPTAKRFKILCEAKAFPSDHYAFRSQAALRGFDPDAALLCLEPPPGEVCLRPADILRTIEEQGAAIAVVCLPGVQYFTGQLLDMAAVTAAGRRQGCLVGWDLAHAVGNVELRLHDWGVDFAVWCHYKYVCGGPGAVGGAFVHSRHATEHRPTLHGWWGHEEASRKDMDNRLRLEPDAKAFRLSCPTVLSTVGVKVGAELLLEAGLPALRAKSRRLTAYLEFLLLSAFPKNGGGRPGEAPRRPWAEVVTPADPEQRGAQLSVRLSLGVAPVAAQMRRRGVSCDVRLPDVVRLAPLPIYNSFADVRRLVEVMRESFAAVAADASAGGAGGRSDGAE